MILCTQRMLLRPWRLSDRDPFAAIVGDPHVMRYYPSPSSKQHAQAWLDKLLVGQENGTSNFLAAERVSDGKLIGLIGTADITRPLPGNPKTEIGWLLAKEFWGQGYAVEGAQAHIHHAFHTQNLPEIVAFTAHQNHPSQRVMQKLGMTHSPDDDFDNDRVPEGNPLRPHVLYRLKKPLL